MRVFSLFAVLVAATTLSTIAAANAVSTSDTQAIQGVLERQREAWNRHDMDAFVAETTPDVEWVSLIGMHWRGRDAVRNGHLAAHRGAAAKSTMEPPRIVTIRELAPGVVLVVRTEKIDGLDPGPAGKPFPAEGALMTVIFVRTSGGWRIVHAQNTGIDAKAIAHDATLAPS